MQLRTRSMNAHAKIALNDQPTQITGIEKTLLRTKKRTLAQLRYSWIF